ncbi:MAG: GNAT family N-acetyltransferase [Candidatus Bathyarchaeia archaeon]|nr:GNAT family N-acetyltransferase [Candidatus Bathyarchaeia archaeon]
MKLNDQYLPLLEGPEAMKRVSECEAAVYLVAEEDCEVVGVIKGIYDGSRTLIHQISVHPKYQKHGVGSALVQEIARRFKEMGAPSVAVTASTKSKGFFEKSGFRELTHAVFMVADSVDEVVEKGKHYSKNSQLYASLFSFSMF